MVEQVFLYKTLYVAILGNSVFPNPFLSQEYTCDLRGMVYKWNNNIGETYTKIQYVIARM